MNDTKLNLHKIHNYLLRLKSITDCIESDGEGFVTEEVGQDIEEALDYLATEFRKVSQEMANENSNQP